MILLFLPKCSPEESSGGKNKKQRVQSTLFTQGFPPAPTSSCWPLFFLRAGNILCLRSVRQVGADSAPRGLQDSPERSPKEPSDHKIRSVQYWPKRPTRGPFHNGFYNAPTYSVRIKRTGFPSPAALLTQELKRQRTIRQPKLKSTLIPMKDALRLASSKTCVHAARNLAFSS